MKKIIVDNSRIELFFHECEPIISEWNAKRSCGRIRITLEDVSRATSQKVIRLDAEPHTTTSRGRLTMLQIWFDAERAMLLGKTPLISVDNTEPVTIERLCKVLEKFNP